jgi:uncharacterized Fe-S center protein
MAGFWGAIKNISIWIGSSEWKVWLHTGGESKTWNIMSCDQNSFLRAMAEAGKSVSDALWNWERILYINVMNRLSIDCDCNWNPAEPDIHDIWILASTDSVAIDKASMDLIYKADNNESFIERVENRNWMLTLEHAEKIWLGSQKYNVVNID